MLCLARTGVRIGESFALEWGDVDFGAGRLRVARSISAGSVTSPKSGRARWVDMTDQLAAVLREHRSVQEAEAAFGGTDPPTLVFPSAHGRYWNRGTYWQRVWAPLLRAADVRHRGPHQLRHTYASLLLSEGVPVTYVSEQLGHSNPRITLEIYARWIPRGGRAEVNRLDEVAPVGVTGRNPRATVNI